MCDEVSVRGYRPGRMTPQDGGEESTDPERLAKVRVYAQRAKARLPLFKDEGAPVAKGRSVTRR